jgi:hypothetical protein
MRSLAGRESEASDVFDRARITRIPRNKGSKGRTADELDPEPCRHPLSLVQGEVVCPSVAAT